MREKQAGPGKRGMPVAGKHHEPRKFDLSHCSENAALAIMLLMASAEC
ncbi:MAG TPA: hypothetical protein VJ652_12075 [Noviherbaspirillum sp.]|nr:hypothetical protein [Noviherbaspirillum sp.]